MTPKPLRKEKIKFKIIDYGKTAKILNWLELKKFGVLSEYKVKTKVKTKIGNILFGVRVLAGDQLDGWATHRHYIAILVKGKNWGYLIDTHETESGWKAPFFQKSYGEWKREILEGVIDG